MRKVMVIVLVLLIAAGGGAYAYWMQQAEDAKLFVANLIATNNSGAVQISYDALETRGFPTKMVVNLVNPRIKGRFDRLFYPSTQPNVTIPEWNDDISLAGTLGIGINTLSNEVSMTTTGKWRGNGTIDNQSVHWVNEDSISFQCVVSIKHGELWATTPWDFNTLKERSSELGRDFRLFDCSNSAYTVLNPDTNKVIVKSGPMRFYVSNEPKGDQNRIRLYLKSIDTEFTPEGDRLIVAYSRAMTSYTATSMQSAYGKQNIDIDFTYTGPIKGIANPMLSPVNIQLSTFAITNDAYNIHADFSFSNEVDAQNQSTRLAFKSVAEYTDIYGPLLHDMLRQSIRQSFDNKLSHLPPELKAKHTPESFYEMLAPMVPNFQELGKVTTVLDLSYQGIPGFMSGDFNLAAFELSTAPYGITGNGTGKRVPGALLPAVNASFTCRNCFQMIEETTHYSNRLQAIVSDIKPDTAFQPLATDEVEGYKNFLQALAGVPAGTKDFTFVVTSDGRGGFSINGKPINEVMMLYHQYLPRKR